MHYIFEHGTKEGKNLLLLHGTGGDEHSLIEIARFLDANATILSLRGTIQEDGMNRYFKRNGLNQFDLESLEKETDHLLAEITAISETKGIPLESWIIVGYSNGANIGAHMMMEREASIKRAILFHPMSLGVDTNLAQVNEGTIWLSTSENDPIVSKEASDQLIFQLEKHTFDVTVQKKNSGHQVTMEEVEHAKKWLSTLDNK
ncbi:alpha/beta hydrolase [Enterococcus termitis]|uniref:Phospholipase n=1 Tax=Enterococcus termitis TaxID=332950 RepID=A0A1E5H6Y9_9ENTE|nr:alpha/beta hydrolase [Enterococcus termitis]OEG20662.1 phospholipase [Enterococcus termitis]OJG99767.1 phospholipase/carboxylesterase [Enterococcus termitis]